MTQTEHKAIMSLIVEREETAFKRLNSNSRYLEVCERQEQTEKSTEELYHQRFTHEERISIRHHYEGETEKLSMEVNEVYIQGWKDCFKLMTFLGLLTD